MKLAVTTFVLATLLAQVAFAQPTVVTKAIDHIRKNNVRTTVKLIQNDENNPCIPLGKSYQVDIQVKRVFYDAVNKRSIARWETVSTLNVSRNGEIMEVCAE